MSAATTGSVCTAADRSKPLDAESDWQSTGSHQPHRPIHLLDRGSVHPHLLAAAIRSVAPKTTILLSGDVWGYTRDGSGPPFLKAVLQAQPSLRKLVDGYSVHAYSGASPPGSRRAELRFAFSRIALCGLVSQYNETKPRPVENFGALLVNRVKLEGFIVSERMGRWRFALDGAARQQAHYRLIAGPRLQRLQGGA